MENTLSALTPFTKVKENTVFSVVDTLGPLLCVDIGSGTQDALLALPHTSIENWPRLILPAPAKNVAALIRQATESQKDIWLFGKNMGGGFAGALKKHMEQGFKVYAHPSAACALYDDPKKVEQFGVVITEQRPHNTFAVELGDFSFFGWAQQCKALNLPMPHMCLAAAQDHGYHPNSSNCEGRFSFWKELFANNPQGVAPHQLVYAQPPQVFTRLTALFESLGHGYVVDSCVAALLGALSMPEVLARSHREGIVLVNVGNSHVIAFLCYKGKLFGVYEHHTGMRTTEELLLDLHEFRMCWLPHEVVRNSGGHGCVISTFVPAETEGFKPTYILGPQRELLAGKGQSIAPYGDMMQAGTFGLLFGLGSLMNVTE